MLQAARHQAILELVRHDRVVRVADLAVALNVSAMTVRRDIETLSESGLVERIHGGAKIPGQVVAHEPGFESKSTQFIAEKQGIACVAAALVEEGMTVGLGAGTTTWALANALLSGPAITVVTNSIRVAEVFYRSPEVNAATEVILIGGQRTASDALVGPLATQALSSINVDVLFLGVHGMDSAAGFTSPNILEAETNRAFIASAGRLVIVTDHSKWGVHGISRIARLEEADEIITDSGISARAKAMLQEQITRIRVAPASGQATLLP